MRARRSNLGGQNPARQIDPSDESALAESPTPGNERYRNPATQTVYAQRTFAHVVRAEPDTEYSIHRVKRRARRALGLGVSLPQVMRTQFQARKVLDESGMAQHESVARIEALYQNERSGKCQKETLGSAHTSVAPRLDPISRQTAGNEQRFSGLEKALYSRARQRSAVSRELIAGQEGNSRSLVTGLRGATPIEAAK